MKVCNNMQADTKDTAASYPSNLDKINKMNFSRVIE